MTDTKTAMTRLLGEQSYAVTVGEDQTDSDRLGHLLID